VFQKSEYNERIKLRAGDETKSLVVSKSVTDKARTTLGNACWMLPILPIPSPSEQQQQQQHHFNK
jgi:hypothetical protein